jgi:hypothetical protein
MDVLLTPVFLLFSGLALIAMIYGAIIGDKEITKTFLFCLLAPYLGTNSMSWFFFGSPST